MAHKLIISLLGVILLVSGVILSNLLTQPSVARTNKPTPTPAVLLTPLPPEQLVPPDPPQFSEVVDLAPDTSKSEKYTLIVNDLKGGMKGILVPAKNLNEEINKIDPNLLISIVHPFADFREELSNRLKIEQSIVASGTVPAIPSVNPSEDKAIPTLPATPVVSTP